MCVILNVLLCGCLWSPHVCIHVGMLSKSRGHILQVAAIMHVLFNWENPQSIPSTISVAAIKAADSFVGVCVQHVYGCKW